MYTHNEYILKKTGIFLFPNKLTPFEVHVFNQKQYEAEAIFLDYINKETHGPSVGPLVVKAKFFKPKIHKPKTEVNETFCKKMCSML